MYQVYVLKDGSLTSVENNLYRNHGELRSTLNEYAIHHPNEKVDWNIYFEYGSYWRNNGVWWQSTSDMRGITQMECSPEVASGMEDIIGSVQP